MVQPCPLHERRFTFTWLRHVKNKRAERWIARPVLLG
jgi:hypothetical protein